MSSKYILQKKDISVSLFWGKNIDNEPDLNDINTILETYPYLRIFPNINNSYKNITEYIYRLVSHSKFLCKGLVPNYIQNTFNKTDAVIVIGSKDSNLLPNGNIFGFASLEFGKINSLGKNDNTLYIDIFCSHLGIKYAGSILMEEITRLCMMSYITKIKLNSVSSAISFYEKCGFVKLTLCDNKEELCEMEKKISYKKMGGKTKRKNKKHSKSRKRRN